MALQTDLSRSPYYDDYNVDKNFYRILYRPGTAVQTRELNQMQSILQDQIDKFGRHVFVEGSVIEGCSFTFDPDYDYVKLSDTYSNSYAFTISDFQDKYVYNANGLKALIINTVVGYSSQDPDLNTIYIKYLNVGAYPNSAPQNIFVGGETITVSGNSDVANTTSIIGDIKVSSVANATGKGYAFNTTSGIIFQKGFFVTVKPQTLIVSKYSNIPSDISVGFNSLENIITPESDTSLLDNAAGAPNYAAPGAHRLQLVPTLYTAVTSEIASSSSFFSLVDFKDGVPVTIRNTAQYAALGKELAQRTYETNGNYIVSPFLLSTSSKQVTDPNYHDYVNLLSSRGVGYAQGYRVEFVNNTRVSLRKGIDTEKIYGQVVSANYGNYALINNYTGDFDTENLSKIELHSVPKYSIANSTFLGVGYSTSTIIGTAFAKALAYESGTIGTADAVYRLYLFTIVMNSGKNFSDVRSIIRTSSGDVKSVADVQLIYNASAAANVAAIQSPKTDTMIFPLGQEALKSDGFSNTKYVYRNKASSQIQTTGISTVGLPAVTGTGTESFNVSGSPLTIEEVRKFVVIPTANAVSTNKAGLADATSSSKHVTGSGTATFDLNYRSGDFIKINGEIHAIDYVVNSTSLYVKTNFSASAVANTHAKAFVAGVPIDYTQPLRAIGIIGSTATFVLGETLASTLQTSVYHDIQRVNAVSIKKNIVKNALVKIDCSTHPANTVGPWSLGLPDIKQINAIYVGSQGVYSNSTNASDVSSQFTFLNGQTDNIYGMPRIRLKNNTTSLLNSDSTILVDFDVFTHDRSQGVGFFTANSYPIDDVNLSNAYAITTQEIPKYTSTSTVVYNLRDCVDYRPYLSNTAVVTQGLGSATVNPLGTDRTFDLLPSGSYIPTNDTNWVSDVEHYLPRKDLAVINTKGTLKIVEGVSSIVPVTPTTPPGVMTLGIVNIPPYPSLTPKEAKNANRYEYAISTSITQNRRYTMKDIGTLATRIDNLEYYTALNLLEQATNALLVKNDTTGLNRFKNGILVDSFAGHDIGDTLDPNYNIAIDPVKKELRPKFNQRREEFAIDLNSSTNVIKVGNLIMLDYNQTQYIAQNYASKTRNCIEGNVYVWKSNVTLIPNYQTSPDLQKGPDVVGSLDMSANWINLQKAWGTQWGNWSTVSAGTSAPVSSKSLNSSATDNAGNVTKAYTERTTTTTSTTQQQTGTQLAITGYNDTKIDLGTYVTDVNILPYIQSSTIKFTATGLKPGARVYAYFNNVDVNAWCMPASSTFGFNRSTLVGSPLIVNDDSSIYGYFTIPPNKFQATELTFMLCDADNLATGSASITTQAVGLYYASKLSIAKGTASLNTREPILAVTEVTQQQTIVTTNNIDTNTVEIEPGAPRPPIVIYIKPDATVINTIVHFSDMGGDGSWDGQSGTDGADGDSGDGDDGDDGCGCDSDSEDCDDDDDDDDGDE